MHFVGLGALLFAGHGLWEHYIAKDDYAISISTAELERQALIFAGENRRDPTDEDLQALIFAYVEEEVLMREALRRGLDADDTIIRRRLAQKMRFMVEDTEMPAPPEDAQLRAWFETRKDEFSIPETRAFVHIYLSSNTHGDDIESAAETLLMRGDLDNWETLGDPFIMKRTYTDVTRTDVSGMYNRARHCFHHIVVLIKDCFITTNHDGQRAINRFWFAATHWSIEHFHAFFCKRCSNFLTC